MATINRSNIGNLHDQITVTLAKEDYFPQYEKSLKNYGKNANIPGFRKGQVPVGMIKKMYGQSVFIDEVLRVAYGEVDKYVKENNPQIFGQPLPMEVDKDQKLDVNAPADYTFNFEIGLKPDVKIKTIEEKQPITKYQITVTDEMLEKELEALKKRAGKLEDQDVQSKDEDLVYLTYTEQGNEAATPIEDVVEYGRVPAELQAKINGAAVDTTFVFTASDIADEEGRVGFVKNALKGNKADAEKTFDVTVTRVATLQPREMDEEFFKEVFPTTEIKDEAGFKAELKKAIAEQLSRYTDERLQNDIFETLVHETEVPLPETFLKRWMQTSGETMKSEEEVAAEWPTFEHQLRWTLISDLLIQKHKVDVNYEEVMADIRARVASYFGATSMEDAPWMESYLEKMAQDENTMNETHRRLMMNKLFKEVEKDLNIATQEVTDEEFSKIPALYHQEAVSA